MIRERGGTTQKRDIFLLQKELFCVFFSLYKTQNEKEEKKKKLTHVVA